MRRATLNIAAIVAGVSLLVACDTDSRDNGVEADKAAIKTAIEGLTDAFVARDWDGFTSYFSDDAVWMPPEHNGMTDRDVWWSLVEPWWHSTAVQEIDITTEELTVTGDWAFERHSEFQAVTIGDNPEPVSIYFKGVWLFQRQADGSWKIARYIWNVSPPPD